MSPRAKNIARSAVMNLAFATAASFMTFERVDPWWARVAVNVAIIFALRWVARLGVRSAHQVDVSLSPSTAELFRAASRAADATLAERKRNGESEITLASAELLQAVERSLQVKSPS